MNINLNLNKDFERTLESLTTKYGEKFAILNGIHETQLDNSLFLSKFTNTDVLADATIDPNANANHKDLRSFIAEKNKPQDKIFGLAKIFQEIEQAWGLDTARDWLEAEFSKAFYLNDAATSSSFFPYCWANSLERLAKEGLFFLDDYNNQPPKHLTTFFDDVIEFTSFLGNRQSGAVGLPDVIVWAYYFWKKDVETGYFMKSPDYYLRQCFQKFIYRLNQPFMRVDQSAFTNVSIFDRPYLESLFGGVEFPDGSLAIEAIEEIIDCQKVFMEVVSEIREEQMFTFPVLTFALLYIDDKFVDEDFARWASNHNMKWQDSNFFCNEDVSTLSNCCRLLSNTKKIGGFVNSIGGSGLSIGSARVSTINLVRIAHESGFNKKSYLELLRERALLDCKALSSMRHILKRNIERGLLPNYQEGALDLSKQYMTIGILGLYEVIDLFGMVEIDDFGNRSYSKEGLDFAVEILDLINEVKDNFPCDFSFNIESIPGETAACVLCEADNLLYRNDKYFMYSNQWIPLMNKCTIQEKCRLGSVLDKKCGGGCIAHINIENRFANEEQAWEMLNYVASQGVIYFAFNTKINTCIHKHAFMGSNTCTKCGEPMHTQFSRVVGFYTPVSSWSEKRRKEFDLRKWYNSSLKD